MLAVTDPATGVRHACATAWCSARSPTAWRSPAGRRMPGVRIDTALSGGAPWHVRVHRISTDRDALAVRDRLRAPLGARRLRTASARDARARPCRRDVAVGRLDDRRPSRVTIVRHVLRPSSALSPNANIMWPHTIVPALVTTVPAG